MGGSIDAHFLGHLSPVCIEINVADFFSCNTFVTVGFLLELKYWLNVLNFCVLPYIILFLKMNCK